LRTNHSPVVPWHCFAGFHPPGWYSAGDAGFTDDDGYVHIMTRTDDVINVAGHRLSSGALEEACLAHPDVVECAVVGTRDAIKGTVPVALLVTSATAGNNGEQIADEVVLLVRERIGAVAALRQAAVVAALPKTRSGKILRNVLRKIADNEPYKLPGTIEDAGVVDHAIEALNMLGLASNRTD
jgi:propionyl-CoA synthetase